MIELIGKTISIEIQDQYDWKYGNLSGVITGSSNEEIT